MPITENIHICLVLFADDFVVLATVTKAPPIVTNSWLNLGHWELAQR